MIYTSANGYMFSIINKEGQIGIRFSKEVQEKYIEQFRSDYIKSYGATMRGYILITDKMLLDFDLLVNLMNESYNFVMSLDPK